MFIKIIGHTNDVVALIVLKSGLYANYLVSGSYDSTIKLWKTTQDCSPIEFANFPSNVRCLLELSDGTIAAGESNSHIDIFNPSNKQIIKQLMIHTDAVRGIDQLPDNR
jgi:WD40 repeat protein